MTLPVAHIPGSEVFVTTASTKPYLIRAIFEWCNDHGYTPFIGVRPDANTRVPIEFVKDGEIVLNLSTSATRNLTISNDLIQFSARFNGTSREVSVPIETVSGIFARENGEGLFFRPEVVTGPETPNPPRSGDAPTRPREKSFLKIVK